MLGPNDPPLSVLGQPDSRGHKRWLGKLRSSVGRTRNADFPKFSIEFFSPLPIFMYCFERQKALCAGGLPRCSSRQGLGAHFGGDPAASMLTAAHGGLY